MGCEDLVPILHIVDCLKCEIYMYHAVDVTGICSGCDQYLIYIASIIKSSMSLSKGRSWIKAFTSCSREHLKGP